MSFDYKGLLNEISKNEREFRTISENEKKELKGCLYEMACDLDRRCKKNGIKLFMVGGTLLGALRYGTFIPWDDDMDFGLSRADYLKIIEIFDDEFSDKYELRCPNSKYPNGNRFMQIFKKGTLLRSLGDNNPFQPKSVYIDIFPYDFVPDNLLSRMVTGNTANMLMGIASCVMDWKYPDKLLCKYMKKTKSGRQMLLFRNVIGSFFSFLSPEKWFDLVDRTIMYKKETAKITSATGRKHYFGEIYPLDCFFPVVEMKFMDHNFYAPRDIKQYLSGLYGADYMTPPPDKAKESHFISEVRL